MTHLIIFSKYNDPQGVSKISTIKSRVNFQNYTRYFLEWIAPAIARGPIQMDRFKVLHRHSKFYARQFNARSIGPRSIRHEKWLASFKTGHKYNGFINNARSLSIYEERDARLCINVMVVHRYSAAGWGGFHGGSSGVRGPILRPGCFIKYLRSTVLLSDTLQNSCRLARYGRRLKSSPSSSLSPSLYRA